MKKYIVLGLILLFAACSRDRDPVKPIVSEMGAIKIVIGNDREALKTSPDSLSVHTKAEKPALVNQLEVRVLKNDNSIATSKTFAPSGGYFEGTIEVKAQDNLKVLCIGTNNGVVERFGVDEDVDVIPGQTTDAVITGWNSRYIPEITGISPNPSMDGSYTVIWNPAPNATAYVLQEANDQQFSGAVASYSTASNQIVISGKAAGTFYYRVQSSNEYNIKSGWSEIVSAVVQNTHTISGTISGADGVTVTLGGDASETQTVNDGETYSFTVAEGGSYTVTPSKPGYSFTPPVQTFNNVTSSHTRDFSGAQDSFTISGKVTGADGVMVILGGDASDSKTVDDGGSYSFTVGGGGNYTVTPFKTDYLFDPASSSFTEIISNQTQNFNGTSSARTYTLSGTVSGADGVTVTLSGDASGSLVVNDGGSYSFTVAEGGNYTITPSKSGFTFTPASRIFNNVTSNQIQNFAANVITYTISGTVSGADGVTITLSGDASDSQVVNDGGSYSFTVAEGDNYTITPSKSGFTFTPASRIFNNVTSNQTQNFDATAITYTISGTISGADDVTVTFSGDDSGSLVVNDGGTYSFTVSHGGSYTVTPSKSGYLFTLYSQTFSNVTSNQTQDFTATEISIPSDITMVSIPAGSFEMGSNDGEEYEKPVHTVTLDAFEMSATEITQVQYNAVIGSNPSYFSGSDDLPVENVSWYDAVKYCNLLSDEAGLERCYDESTWDCDFTKNGYRLPTEAEWEYACRAGTATMYYSGDSESDLSRVGWFIEISNKTHPVGQKEPNEWGLYDMHGNVWEWCNDWYASDYYSYSPSQNPTGPQTGSHHVLRGGSYQNTADGCAAVHREYDGSPVRWYNSVGFRVGRGAFTPGYTISGTVTGTDGVTVSLSGDDSDSQTVNDGGSYSFTVEHGGNYTVMPSKSGYSFTPASKDFSSVNSNQTQDFTATENVPKEIVMVSIPGGTFQMGSNDGSSGERPVHTVTLDAFQMSSTEITKSQYDAITGANPSYFAGDNLPVTLVSWYDAVRFCNALSDSAGLEKCYDESTWECDFSRNGFRLPTEAEWEYACRAGTTTKYYTGDSESDLDRAGWYSSNSSLKTHTVGGKTANAWRLYDMHGNVWEWCNDWYGSYGSESAHNPSGAQRGSSRVLRGGCCSNFATFCRSAYRHLSTPDSRKSAIGFRVVRRMSSHN